eukprot:7594869-Pyramimonas_sp.AAC.1
MDGCEEFQTFLSHVLHHCKVHTVVAIVGAMASSGFQILGIETRSSVQQFVCVWHMEGGLRTEGPSSGNSASPHQEGCRHHPGFSGGVWGRLPAIDRQGMGRGATHAPSP